ncbi:transposase [Sphingobium scionense]|uniref:Transposase n=1 Tax=Sphingobium scionense TaxID=1404341 RepID=A0A7W6LX38_9SPHN|nr:transposase [Sphingobium scionense]
MGQITVFGGPERRRRWHEDERAKILSEAFSPGACVARVARQHDVSTALIYTWRRKACQASGVAGSSTAAQVGFVEAVVLDDGGSKQAPSPPAVVVDLPGGRRVNIYASAPPGVAAAVLKALIR